MMTMIKHADIRTAMTHALLMLAAIALLCRTQTASAQTTDDNAGGPALLQTRMASGGVIRSTDGGRSWTIVDAGQLQRERVEQAREGALAERSGMVRITSIARSGSTLIVSYDLLRAADVALGICGVRGAMVAEEHPGMRPPGSYSIAIDGAMVAPGGYCYRIVSEGAIVAAGKFILE